MSSQANDNKILKRYDPPLRVVIPLPYEIPQGRGINSTSHYGGNLRVRCTNDEYDAAMKEATELGLSLAAYCRSIITSVTRVLRDHRERGSSDFSAGSEL